MAVIFLGDVERSQEPDVSTNVLLLKKKSNSSPSTLQIKTATEEALNKTVTINSIVVPVHIGVHALGTLKQAAIDEGLITEYQQVTGSLNADRLAYNLDSCTGFKLPPNESCDLEYTNLVLVFNYEPERLSVAMLDVGPYICQPYNIEHYTQLGEMRGSIVSVHLFCYCTFLYL